jgi:hypothetical protein
MYLFAFLVIAALGIGQQAHATCPSSEAVLSELTCSSSVTGRIAGRDASSLGGTCGSSACYSCGSPTAGVAQVQAEDVYSFTCQRSGTVTLEMSGLDCNLDLYVLSDTCDPYSGCVQGTDHSGTSVDGITFSCTAGQTYYVVVEGYGFGLPGSSLGACNSPDSGDYTINFNLSSSTGCSEDCDDRSDNDLDGDVDCSDSDCFTDPLCAHDADHDGYVDSAYGGDDCDDGYAPVNPAATEVCDGLDNDCDGNVDGATAIDAYTYYRDADGDTFGNAASPADDCSPPAGYVPDDTDCDDTRSTSFPGGAEVCDSRDNDCDGSIDEGLSATWYRDADGDSYGNSATSVTSCAAPLGYVNNGSDCNDLTALVNPAASEVCDSIDNDCDGVVDDGVTLTWYQDSDGDGYGTASTFVSGCSAPAGYVANASDCNDRRSGTYPGAAEACDGLDNDCDGSVDEGVTSTWYRDADSDGYGNPSTTASACSAPVGYVADASDCDDARSTTNPGAVETCNGRDDNCNGTTDESSSADASTWYRDADGDGYGTASSTTVACSLPAGYAANSTDCDDTAATVSPVGIEACNGRDDDCDGTVDDGVGTVWYRDADGDGYGTSATVSTACSAPAGYVAVGTDCDDTRLSVYPGAAEACDGLDNDCDGATDETIGTVWYVDADGDGYGEASLGVTSCTAPAGYVADASDCDDADAAVHPGATELCDGLDDNCDGSVDEASSADAGTWYRDADADGYGSTYTTVDACSAPAGYVSIDTDCDDAVATTHPAASELCNGRDDDCDGTADEGVGSVWYRDADSDGYGTVTVPSVACTAPAGYVSLAGDCDDVSVSVNPVATELCNGVDDDCDGTIDDGLASTWYADSDGDGFGNVSVPASACIAPAGYVSDATDCDDGATSIHPGATETCDSLDDDCDGSVDEAGGATWYADADGDGFGDVSVTRVSCTAPAGYVSTATDCDDSLAGVHPGAGETCDGRDDDCDGAVDETGGTTWYADTDGDGYGSVASAVTQCDAPAGYVSNATDCDDGRTDVSPGAPEVCDGVDDDCDGLVDESGGTTWYADSDGDGYGDTSAPTVSCVAPAGTVADATDCDDADGTSYPGGVEACDGADNDCDGVIDNDTTDAVIWYADADGDTHGDPATSMYACAAPAGYVSTLDDCWDGAADVHPGAPEVEDGVDNDCNGVVDEGSDGFDDDGDGYAELGGDCDDTLATVHPGASETCDGLDEDCDGGTDEATSCSDDDGDGWSEADGDCNDADVAVSPGHVEVDLDGVDNDCDGDVDGGAGDDDGDGYGTGGGDCDDTLASVHPGATEEADGLDNDCDGVVDEGTSATDDDGDGMTEEDGDCDDTDATIRPDAYEAQDGVDNNCDGRVDEGSDLTDDDGDGFSEVGGDCDDTNASVSPLGTETADGQDDDCNGVVDDGLSDFDDDGYTFGQGDCDDFNGWTNPGAYEVCDGHDNNCNGTVDEGCGEETGLYDRYGRKGCATDPDGPSGLGVLALLPALLLLAARPRSGSSR